MELRHTAQSTGKLLHILRGELRLSSGLVGRLKYENAFLVNGVPRHTDFPVQPGDQITVILLEPAPNYPAEDGPLRIRYEDDALIVVDKPPGLMIHPSAARNTGTLANRLLFHFAQQGQSCAVHPLTRLDRDTFGLVLLAKQSHAGALLYAQQRAGSLHKTYEALVLGSPQQQTIDAPIARLDDRSLLRCVRPDGQTARTGLEPLHCGTEYSLVRLIPFTGRTHQLRVHCAWIGHPILGDPQYGTPAEKALSARLELPFQQLCAKQLCFEHPYSHQELEFSSGFCLDLEKFVAPEEKPVYNRLKFATDTPQ